MALQIKKRFKVNKGRGSAREVIPSDKITLEVLRKKCVELKRSFKYSELREKPLDKMSRREFLAALCYNLCD